MGKSLSSLPEVKPRPRSYMLSCTCRRPAATKTGSEAARFDLAYRSDKNYLLQCNTAIGVAVLLPFLGVSSLNFGPLATAAFFLRWFVLAKAAGEPQLDFLLRAVIRSR